MKAKFVNFERSGNPFEKLNIGIYKIPPTENLVNLNKKEHIGSELFLKLDLLRNSAMEVDKTNGFRKYVEYLIMNRFYRYYKVGNFKMWIKSNEMSNILKAPENLTLKDIKEALSNIHFDDISHQENAQNELIKLAQSLGIE